MNLTKADFSECLLPKFRGAQVSLIHQGKLAVLSSPSGSANVLIAHLTDQGWLYNILGSKEVLEELFKITDIVDAYIKEELSYREVPTTEFLKLLIENPKDEFEVLVNDSIHYYQFITEPYAIQGLTENPITQDRVKMRRSFRGTL